jgi:phosphoribosylanthranilate isomerase
MYYDLTVDCSRCATMTEIKICGLTNRGDAAAASEFGADYLGFVMYPKSPRAVTASEVRDIVTVLRKPVRAVGVFVNGRRAAIERAVEQCGLYAVQLCGDERPEEYEEFPVEVWRAVRRRDSGWEPLPEHWPAARYVVDAASPGLYGGTGKVADWMAAKSLALARPVMLAGGLTPDNVAEGVRTVRPTGVDVASGVESAPGRKDRAKLERFIAAVRSGDGG